VYRRAQASGLRDAWGLVAGDTNQLVAEVCDLLIGEPKHSFRVLVTRPGRAQAPRPPVTKQKSFEKPAHTVLVPLLRNTDGRIEMRNVQRPLQVKP
jgi:hypothetical protein